MKSVDAKTALGNCELLGTDADQASYVLRSTPLDCKRRDLHEANTDENPVRVREVSRRRVDKTGVRPL
jgi:hypothetical protein